MNKINVSFQQDVSMLLIVFAMFFSFAANASASSRPYISGHGLNFAVGNKYLAENDLTLDAPVGSALSFKRSYNSQKMETGLLGFGWNFPYGTTLKEEPGRIILIATTGRHFYYIDNGAGAWINETGKLNTITTHATGYQLTLADGSVVLFDADGRIKEKLSLNGLKLSYTYDAENLTAITDSFGRTLGFAYNENGFLETLTSTIGIFSYTYDADSNLVSVVKPDGTTRQYIYDDSTDVHNLTGIIDESGERILTVAYDTQDRVISSALSNNSGQITIEYPSSLQRNIIDSDGVVSTYQLIVQHGIYRVASFTGPGCSACGAGTGSEYTYTSRQQIDQLTDAKGTITSYEYDEKGNRISKTEAVGTPEERTTTYSYHPVTNKVATVTEKTDNGERITTSTYDSSGNLLSKTEAGGEISRTSSYTYDALGRLTSLNGPRTDVNDITTFLYYPNEAEQGLNRGYLQSVTNALDHTTSYSQYNAYGRAGTVDTPTATIVFTYDAMGQLLSKSNNGLTLTNTYDLKGRVVRVDLPEGRSVTYEYDLNGKPQTISDTPGNFITYTYDAKGQKTKEEIFDPQHVLQRYVSYSYEETGDLDKTTYADGSSEDLNYDPVGNLVARINALGKTTTYSYDALNRLTAVTEPGTSITAYSYDIQDNPVSVTDAEGRQTIYTYDALGRKLSRTSPDTGTNIYTYDSGNNLLSSTNANGISTTYEYDVLNRLSVVHYPDSAQDVAYSYDQNGHAGLLTTMQDATGTTDYNYDSLGRMTQEVRNLDGLSFNTTYSYTDNNEPAAITYPSGRLITYSRNSTGRVTSVTTSYNGEASTITDSISNLPFGPITSMTLANGLQLQNSFDQLYRLTNVTAGALYNRDYSYLANGLVQSMTDGLNPASSQSFTYDDLNRLLTAQGKYGDMSYTYDKVGNRLSRILNNETTNYTYQTNSNRLLQTDGSEIVAYNYDDVGNITQKGETSLNWTEDNRLSSASELADTIGQYGYDGRGLRVKRTVEEHTLYAVYDQGGNLLLEADEQGNTLREYAYLGSSRLTMFDYTAEAEFTVTVSTSTDRALEGVKVYAFNENGSYTGINQTTDEQGSALFDRDNFGEGLYTFRVDYLGSQFWSDNIVVRNSNSVTVLIEEEEVEMTVTMAGEIQEGVKVYLFSESGAYLGIYGITDSEGKVSFILPEGENYTFRADLFGAQFWSDTITVADGGSTGIIATGGGTLTFTLQDNGSPLPGIKTYLFTATGSYLGSSGTSDDQGRVSYTVPQGMYTIRTDYLGYRFWSGEISVTVSTTAVLNIPHQSVTVTVTGDLSGDIQPYAGVKTYLFSPSGSYLGISQTTNENGQAVFYLPEREYKVRADYLGAQYWSDLFTGQDSSITIGEGTIRLEVTNLDTGVQGIRTYLFSDSGSYLGVSVTTDYSGEAVYRVPAGSFSLRADYQGNYYWGDITVSAHQDNPLTISTGGADFTLTLTDGSAPLAGIKTYLFSAAGSYLGETRTTDSQGRAGYAIADGSYKIRIDYLGYRYWTEVLEIPLTDSLEYTIAHQDVTISAIGDNNGDQRPLTGSRLYLFTPSGSYQGISATTDDNGQAIFSLPPWEYKVRLDFLGHQYWSETFNQLDTQLILAEGTAEVTVTGNGNPLTSISVYLFSEFGSYLGQREITSTEGKVNFRLPEGTYKFRADYQSNHFWATGLITGHQNNPISLDTGGGSLTMTVFSGASTVLSGVKTYLFSAAGSYLGQSATTDDQGIVSYDVADGEYKVRVDYLGYRFWSASLSVPETVTGSVMIEHQNVTISVLGDEGEIQKSPLESVRCYLFTSGGSYTGIAADTDDNGRATFSVPPAAYKVRADYLSAQYWSGEFTQTNTDISIIHGEIDLHVTNQYQDLIGARVYLFTESGSYLSRSEVTDQYGKALFTIPEGSYKLRIDSGGEQHWTDVIHVIGYQTNSVELELSELVTTNTNNPRPVRYDGEPPVYSPLLASIGSIDYLFTSSVVDEPRTYYFISDHLGTGQLLVDANQQIVWQGEHSPFGQMDVVVDLVSNNFRFPGQYFDAETGLHYNWNRYYDPDSGRYISADPIGLDGGINLYQYANANPIKFIDPKGLVCGVTVYRTKAMKPVSVSEINAGHQWIEYPSGSIGFWPNRGWKVLSPDPCVTHGCPKDYTYNTKQRKFGKLKWGSGAGTECKCATCSDIVSCVKSAPNPGWRSNSIRNNCRRFSKWVAKTCCLKF